MAVHRVSKGIASFSLVLGCLVLGVSIWTFGSLLFQCVNHKNDANNSSIINVTNESYSSGGWGEFEEMPASFQAMIFSCDWISVGAAILQIVISSVLIFSSARKVQERLKYFVALHCVSLLLVGVTLFLPLAYDRLQDEFHSMTSFGTEVKEQLSKLESVSVVNFIKADLHAYYAILLVDFVGVVGVIVGASCLLRHSIQKDHEVELFYDRYR